ncbi:olfactory receptor 6N1-like [Mixophyes fleayi]|uniref:olfactory receptor 6N1-like n=1 Tax=Mixophyes fleayi TaxID=3061075 RepID=UPI003F4D77E2
MTDTNETAVTEFILVGFYGAQNIKPVLLAIFLFIYIVTVTGNLVIITIVYGDAHLHTPMYFFLSNLSFLEILYTSNIIPQMLFNIITKIQTVPFIACIVQLYFFGSLGSTECFLLGVMAYDRYIAICKPLHYSILMTTRTTSYVHIILTMLRMPSSRGQQRAFSTCTAHLTVVVIFYGAMIFMYVSPNLVNSIEFNKVLALLYTVVTPFMNPFIYTLRNQEVRQALRKAIRKTCNC